MPRARSKDNGARGGQDRAAKLGFEAELWQAADALRNNMDAAEYKHVVLGLIFLKYISDAFEAKRAERLLGRSVDLVEPGRMSNPYLEVSIKGSWERVF